MVPLRSWLSRVSQTATSGTLVTPSVITMIPVSNRKQVGTLTMESPVEMVRKCGIALSSKDAEGHYEVQKSF